MLYLIGLGLGDEKDITIKGLEAVKNADLVFLESYTSVLGISRESLVRNNDSLK
jgi:diphthine synthase